MPVRLLLLLALLAALVAAPAALAQGGVLQEAATALKRDSVYVHPDANPGLTQAEADALRSRITERDAGPMYIAVLPERAASEAGGSVTPGAHRTRQAAVGRPGTYAVVIGRRFRAGSTRGLPEGVTGEAADAAVRAKRGQGLPAILLDFVDRMGEVRAGRRRGRRAAAAAAAAGAGGR